MHFCITYFIHVASDPSTNKIGDRSKSSLGTSIHDTSTFTNADKISEENPQGHSSAGCQHFCTLPYLCAILVSLGDVKIFNNGSRDLKNQKYMHIS